MKKLEHTQLLIIYGGNFKGGLGAIGSSLTGMVMGATTGAKILPVLMPYLTIQSQSYISLIKASITDLYLWNKFGHLGISSKPEAIGAVGGALVGSVLGSGIFGMIMV